jgi:hypothetical protein
MFLFHLDGGGKIIQILVPHNVIFYSKISVKDYIQLVIRVANRDTAEHYAHSVILTDGVLAIKGTINL